MVDDGSSETPILAKVLVAPVYDLAFAEEISRAGAGIIGVATTRVPHFAPESAVTLQEAEAIRSVIGTADLCYFISHPNIRGPIVRQEDHVLSLAPGYIAVDVRQNVMPPDAPQSAWENHLWKGYTMMAPEMLSILAKTNAKLIIYGVSLDDFHDLAEAASALETLVSDWSPRGIILTWNNLHWCHEGPGGLTHEDLQSIMQDFPVEHSNFKRPFRFAS